MYRRRRVHGGSQRTIGLGIAIAIALSLARPAAADVDWARGLVTADGIGVANRAAPSPAAARGPARRMAEEAARGKLAPQLGALPVAAGGTLAAKLKDPAIEAAVADAVANAIVVGAELETDGSWKVTMAVPIESLRQVLAGQADGRALPGGGDDGGPAVVVIEGANVKPAIGYRVGAVAGATVFVKDVPAWAKGAPRVKAKGAKAGVIDAAAANATDATLFVIHTK